MVKNKLLKKRNKDMKKRRKTINHGTLTDSINWSAYFETISNTPANEQISVKSNKFVKCQTKKLTKVPYKRLYR